MSVKLHEILKNLSRAFIAFLVLIMFLFMSTCKSTDANEEIDELPPEEYILTVKINPEEAGKAEPDSGSFQKGSEIEVTAVANTGWSFVKWNIENESTDNPISLVMDRDRSIEAHFEPTDYSLVIEIEGEGEVEEEIVQANKTSYDEGTTVQLTAVANTGWKFKEWKGDLNSSDNPTTIVMDAEKQLTAVFEKRGYLFSSEVEGKGSIAIELLSGEETENGYLYESELRLTAEPVEGWLFISWEGDTTTTENPITLSISGDTNIKAIFQREGFDLTVETDGDGTVDEEIVQSKTTNYPSETNVELTAIPSTGWKFNDWSGDLSGSENPNLVVMDADKSITAHFSREEFELNLEKQGEGNITITLLSGTETENGYLYESIIELAAEADEHWYFSSWTGDVNGDQNPLEIEIVEDISIDGVFEPVSYPVNIQIDGEGNVSETLKSGTEMENGYQYNSEVELEATPSTGWKFSEWVGDIESTENPLTINVQGEVEMTAVFVKEYYDLNVEIEGSGSVNEELLTGEINSENKYIFESEIELTAEPADGWMFARWENDLSGGENPTTIVMDRDKSIQAFFEEISLEYTVNLIFKDSKGEFEMEFGQSKNPGDLRRLAPPPPPSGALNAFFVFNGENYIRDYRSSSETDVTWELHYKAGDGEDLTLTWNFDDTDISGTMTITDQENSFEIDMLEDQSLDLSDTDEGILIINFEFY